MWNVQEFLVATISQIDFLFPSVIFADNNRADVVFNTVINNKPGDFMHLVLHPTIPVMQQVFDPFRHSFIPYIGLKNSSGLVIPLVKGFDSFAISNERLADIAYTCSQIVNSQVYGNKLVIRNDQIHFILIVNDFHHKAGGLGNNPHLLNIFSIYNLYFYGLNNIFYKMNIAIDNPKADIGEIGRSNRLFILWQLRFT